MRRKPPPLLSPVYLYPQPQPLPPTLLHATLTAKTITPLLLTILGIMKQDSLHLAQTCYLPQPYCPSSLHHPLPVQFTTTSTFMQICRPEANKFHPTLFKTSTIHNPHKFSFTKSTITTLTHTLTPQPPPPKTYCTSFKPHFSLLNTSTTTNIFGDYTLTKEERVLTLLFSCLHCAPSCKDNVPYMCTLTPQILSISLRHTHPTLT